MPRQTGTIKWFNREKGYGFIKPDDGSPDVFVHKTALDKAKVNYVEDGQSVSFDIEPPHNAGERSKACDIVIL